MKKEEIKLGMYVDFKLDYEESGKIISLPDKNGYVNIDGGDSEQGPLEFNIHIDELTEME